LRALPYPILAEAAQAAGVRTGTVVDNDYVMPDISRSAERIPLMVGTVMAEFSANLQGATGSYRNGSILQDESVFYRDNRRFNSEERVIARYRERYGEDAEAVMAAFQAAYPTHDLFDGLYTWALRNNHVASAYTEAGGRAYQYVMAYNLPLFDGIVSWHTGGDIAFFFRNLDTVRPWVAGDEEVADQVSRQTAQALVNFAYTGNPGQERLDWPAFSIDDGETMI
ncbi:MAG: carboxylesterase family protein, partial [Desulfuromonadales bacterium]|nr:carboxylesterase family protein [Desulfuromonadales bacterium]